VSKQFLANLFGKSSSHAPEVASALGELATLQTQRPACATAFDFLRELLPQLFDNSPAERAPVLDTEKAKTKLRGGLPLLRGEVLWLDEEAFRVRWRGICRALRKSAPGQTSRDLEAALRGGKLAPGELLGDVLDGNPGAVHARAEKIGLDPSVTATAVRLVLLPVLSHLRGELNSLLKGIDWQFGYCPLCGSWPLLGEFRGLEQVRYLCCGLCACSWESPRLRCPFCDNTDHRLLGHVHVEGEENRYRAATCDACRGYVKMVTSLAALSTPQLLVADAATLHLDLVIAERGYLVS
jgi:FdhE protein